MTIDKNQLEQAKNWARGVINNGSFSPESRSAAEMIRDLPDEWVSADKLRELTERWRSSKNEYRLPVQAAYETVASDLDALLPDPTPQVEIALGAWAMHPEHGKVLIASTHDWENDVRVVVENRSKNTDIGSWQAWVSPADLSPVPSDTPTEEAHYDDLPWHVKETLKMGIEDMQAGRFADIDITRPITITQEALFEDHNAVEPIKGTVMDIAGPPHDGGMQPEIQEKFDMMKELGYTDVHPRLRMVTIGEWEL